MHSDKLTRNGSVWVGALLACCVVLAVSTGILLVHSRQQQQRISDLRSLIREEIKGAAPGWEALIKRELQMSSKENDGPMPHRRYQEVALPIVDLKDPRIVPDAILQDQVAGMGIEPDTSIQGGIVKSTRSREVIQMARAGSGGKAVRQVQENEEHKPERQEAIERTLQQKGSVLLPKGQSIIEPSFTYAHFSSNRINIQGVTILDILTIGPVSTQKIQRDIFIQTMSFKHGLMENLQGELRVPLRYEFDRVSNSDQTQEEMRSKGGLGDIDFSLSRQIGWEEGWRPDLIASLGVKTNTGQPIYNNSIGLGSGHWSVRASVVAAKSSDPVVVFSSLSYIYNLPRTFSNYGEVKPGDTIAYSVGMALALSYQTAINFSFDESITQQMRRDGVRVVGSFVNSANFKTGLNWAFNERASVDLSMAMGLTADSPDMTVEIRFPIKF